MYVGMVAGMVVGMVVRMVVGVVAGMPVVGMCYNHGMDSYIMHT